MDGIFELMELHRNLIRKSWSGTRLVLLLALCVGVWIEWSSGTDITGHWHLVEKDSSLGDYDYYLLDVYADGTACFECDPVRGGGFGGVHERSERALYLGGECMIFDLTYQVERDSLLIYQTRYPNDDGSPHWTGVRHDVAYCDMQTEYFRTERLAVRLPLYTSSITNVRDVSLSQQGAVYVGQLKHKAQDESETMVSLGGVVHTIGEHDSYAQWWEQLLVKQPDAYRSRLRPVIYADKGVDDQTIQLVAQKLRAVGAEPVCRAYMYVENGRQQIGITTLEGPE